MANQAQLPGLRQRARGWGHGDHDDADRGGAVGHNDVPLAGFGEQHVPRAIGVLPAEAQHGGAITFGGRPDRPGGEAAADPVPESQEPAVAAVVAGQRQGSCEHAHPMDQNLIGKPWLIRAQAEGQRPHPWRTGRADVCRLGHRRLCSGMRAARGPASGRPASGPR